MALPSEHAQLTPWKRFWEKGAWWKAVLLAVVYYVAYQLGGFLFAPLGKGLEAGSVGIVMVDFILPIAFGGLLLVILALSVGWLRELFGPQPIRGRGWMWIAVAVGLLFYVLRFASLDYGKAGFEVIAAWLLAGQFIGFGEEVLTRGFVVNIMRKAGHPEIAVALVSAMLFAALHAGNIFTGQGGLATVLQVFYTFCFGICMYLALRVTGNLIWPILLHASTDPSIFLLTEYPGAGPLTSIAGLGNFAVMAMGIVALFLIRGRVNPRSPKLG